MVDCCSDSEGFPNQKIRMLMSKNVFTTTVSNVSLHCNQEMIGLLQEGLKVTVERYQTARSHLFQRCAYFSLSVFALPRSVCCYRLTLLSYICARLLQGQPLFRTLCASDSKYDRGAAGVTHIHKKKPQTVVWHSAGRSACWLRSAGDTYNLPLNPASARPAAVQRSRLTETKKAAVCFVVAGRDEFKVSDTIMAV